MLFKKIFSFAEEYFLMASISKAGIKIARRNINNLRYADDTTLMAEIKEELKSLLMKVKKESEKADLKFNNNKKRLEHLVPSLQGSKGLSKVFSNTTVQSINSSALAFIYSPTLTSIHDYWKNHSLD